MPFQQVPLHSARCHFTGGDCHKNCAAAIAHPEHVDWWRCKWIVAMDGLMDGSAFKAQIIAEATKKK